jgi:tRNA(Arg) A34 adenosine deaminase TadA
MGAILWCGISRLVYGASIAELAAKTGQIMVTDAEIAGKTPFAEIAITGGCSRRNRSRCSNEARR